MRVHDFSSFRRKAFSPPWWRQVTYHVLYNAAAAEAKLRMAGVRDLSAAATWARVGALESEW